MKAKSPTQHSDNGISKAIFRHGYASLFFLILSKNYFSLLSVISESTIFLPLYLNPLDSQLSGMQLLLLLTEALCFAPS